MLSANQGKESCCRSGWARKLLRTFSNAQLETVSPNHSKRMTQTESVEYTDQELRLFFGNFKENLPSDVRDLLADERVPVRSIVDRLHEAAAENPRVGRIWADVLKRFPHREPMALELRKKRSLRVVAKLAPV